MKTITEFTATTLKNALKTKRELTAAGKTAEELPAAMGEALKLEGDKLNLLLSAIEVVEKKTDDLKRVVVLTLQEGEKAPRGTEQKGDHYFSIEFFPPMPGQERKKPGHGRGERDGKGKDRGRGGKRGGRGERSERGGRGAPQAGGPGEAGKPAGGEGDRNRRDRRPRGPGRGPVPVQQVGQAAPNANPAVRRAPIQPLQQPIQPKQQPAAPTPETSGDGTPTST